MNNKLAIILAALSLAACKAGNGKNDIFGFMAGMKKETVHAHADSKKWRCEAQSEAQDICYTLNGPMRVIYATNMDGAPASELHLAFDQFERGKVQIEDQAADISKQYGKEPDERLRNRITGDIEEIRWNLDDGNILILQNLNGLSLVNPAIARVNEDAGRENAKKSSPTPKF